MANGLELLNRTRAGDVSALARLCRLLEEGRAEEPVVDALNGPRLEPIAVGVTGSPGAGKSTLVSRLVSAYRAQGARVVVLAVDPTSPFSGGALLGDRIRMLEHSEDPEVFIRSMATRGAVGGLAAGISDCIGAGAEWGAGVVLVETVGVGQVEFDVMDLCDTTLLVLAPEMGDGIQAAKAGILEVADILAVNKADLPGAAATLADLQGMLAMGSLGSPSARGHLAHGAGAPSTRPKQDSVEWEVALHRVVANSGEGVDELLGAIARHRSWLATPSGAERRVQRRARAIRRRLLGALVADLERRHDAELTAWADQVVSGSHALSMALKSLLPDAPEG